MEEVEKRVLSRLRSQLTKEMVVTESFLSSFCQSDLLDEHSAAVIRAESNFEKRASKLLETLPSQNSKAFFTLLEILEITNPWLSEKMKTALHDERTRDAKINLHPSVAKNASIEGFGHTRLHIDHDIKERSTKFVHTNLYHLTEVEQRGVDKWLADELQRERRRQQFRAPLDARRDRTSFHSSKETQTDTCSMDLREMYDELAIYLHGVDYDEQGDKLSFGLIQVEVKELLGRTKKLDNLFLNCWNKFDDTDKYSMSLPDLIDRTVHHEKRLMTTEELNKQMIQKLKDERDNLKRRIHKLEEDTEKLTQRYANVITPQEMQLRHRQSIHMRYTFPYAADNNMMKADNESDQSAPSYDDPHGSNESKHNGNSQNNDKNNVSPHSEEILPKNLEKAGRNGSHKAATGQTNTTNHNVNRVNGTGGYIHRAEPVHFEEKRSSVSSCSDDNIIRVNIVRRNSYENAINNATDGLEIPNSSSSKRGGDTKGKDRKGTQKTQQNMTNANFHYNGPKIRRHASEESLRMAISRDETNSSITSRLKSDLLPKKLSVEDLPTAVAQQSKESVPRQQQNRINRVDLQSRMQKMITNYRQEVDAQRQNGSGNVTDKSKTQVSYHGNKGNTDAMNSREGSFKGKTSLQVSYEMIHNSRNNQKDNMSNNLQGNVNDQKKNQQQLNGQGHYPSDDKQALFLMASRYNVASTENQSKDQQVERYVQHGHPYRSLSNERIPQTHKTLHSSPARSTIKLHAHHSFSDSHQRDYTSDSELVLKPSSLRAKTARGDKSRSRVRFASPIARTTNPNKKGSGRSHKVSHYQMDTASTARKKINQ